MPPLEACHSPKEIAPQNEGDTSFGTPTHSEMKRCALFRIGMRSKVESVENMRAVPVFTGLSWSYEPMLATGRVVGGGNVAQPHAGPGHRI